ncbi:MAG: hypothetical protein OXC62_01045 [Aestuariivita sp.]|nr:hypothetical protein [Aestuariivita sp.]
MGTDGDRETVSTPREGPDNRVTGDVAVPRGEERRVGADEQPRSVLLGRSGERSDDALLQQDVRDALAEILWESDGDVTTDKQAMLATLPEPTDLMYQAISYYSQA